jgi:hypothetical protein
MNYPRVVLTAVVATVAFFIYGFLVHGILIAADYVPYPEGVYRTGAAAQSHMLYSLTGIFVAILVFATIYAHSYKGGRGLGKALAWASCLEFSLPVHSCPSTMEQSISAGNSR